MFDNYKDIVGVDDLCEMLCIGKNKAYELLTSKQIPSIRVGRTYKIPKQGIINYVLNNLASSPT